LGNVTTSTFGADGKRLSTTDEAGNVTTYGYDAAGRLVTITDPAGNVTRMEYGLEGSGAFGQLTATVYPTYREEYQYDARGRKTQTVQILPPEGGNPEKRLTQSTGYDAVGNRITETDAAGRITRYQYDALNRLVSTTDANAGVTRYGYDVRDNLLTVTDANDNTHTF